MLNKTLSRNVFQKSNVKRGWPAYITANFNYRYSNVLCRPLLTSNWGYRKPYRTTVQHSTTTPMSHFSVLSDQPNQYSCQSKIQQPQPSRYQLLLAFARTNISRPILIHIYSWLELDHKPRNRDLESIKRKYPSEAGHNTNLFNKKHRLNTYLITNPSTTC